MKRNPFVYATVLFLLTLSIASCKKDDDTSSNTNKVTFNNNTYQLTKGFLSDIGDNGNGSWDFDVILSTDGISPGSIGVTGTGTLLYLDLNTTDGSGLENGTYNWSDSRAPFTVVPGSTMFVDFDFDSFTGMSSAITGGTVEIDVNGNTVTIDFTLQTSTGAVTGNYTGALTDI